MSSPAAAEPRDPQHAARLASTEALAAVMVDSGLPRMAARVLALLLHVDAGEATAAELAEDLQASPAAISGAVRYLLQTRLVARTRKPGERKDTYALSKGDWYDDIMGGRSQELLRWAAASRHGADLLGHDSPAGTRLDETARFFEFLDGETAGLMERWHAEQKRR